MKKYSRYFKQTRDSILTYCPDTDTVFLFHEKPDFDCGQHFFQWSVGRERAHIQKITAGTVSVPLHLDNRSRTSISCMTTRERYSTFFCLFNLSRGYLQCQQSLESIQRIGEMRTGREGTKTACYHSYWSVTTSFFLHHFSSAEKEILLSSNRNRFESLSDMN